MGEAKRRGTYEDRKAAPKTPPSVYLRRALVREAKARAQAIGPFKEYLRRFRLQPGVGRPKS